MTEEKFINVNTGEGQGSRGGWNPADFAALMGGNNRGGLFGNGGGIWDGVLGLFGLGLVANMFPNIMGGGRDDVNSPAAAAYLANIQNNNHGVDLLMEHVTGVGNRVVELAQAFNTTTAAVQAGLSNIQLAMVQLAAQNNTSVYQLQLQLQKGQSDIALQFCNCCKDQALAMCQQTNTLVTEGNQNTQRIVDSQSDGFRSILQQMFNDKLESKNEKIAELTALALAKDGEISQMRQNQYFAGLVGQSQAQTDAKLSQIMSEVEAIKRCQPPTITLPNNQYTAVPTFGANIVSDFLGTLAVARLLNLSGGTNGNTGGGTDTGGTGTTPT